MVASDRKNYDFSRRFESIKEKLIDLNSNRESRSVMLTMNGDVTIVSGNVDLAIALARSNFLDHAQSNEFGTSSCSFPLIGDLEFDPSSEISETVNLRGAISLILDHELFPSKYHWKCNPPQWWPEDVDFKSFCKKRSSPQGPPIDQMRLILSTYKGFSSARKEAIQNGDREKLIGLIAIRDVVLRGNERIGRRNVRKMNQCAVDEPEDNIDEPVENGDEPVENENEQVENGDDLVENGDELVENGDGLVENGDELVENGDDLVENEDEPVENDNESLRRSNEGMGKDIPSSVYNIENIQDHDNIVRMEDENLIGDVSQAKAQDIWMNELDPQKASLSYLPLDNIPRKKIQGRLSRMIENDDTVVRREREYSMYEERFGDDTGFEYCNDKEASQFKDRVFGESGTRAFKGERESVRGTGRVRGIGGERGMRGYGGHAMKREESIDKMNRGYAYSNEKEEIGERALGESESAFRVEREYARDGRVRVNIGSRRGRGYTEYSMYSEDSFRERGSVRGNGRVRGIRGEKRGRVHDGYSMRREDTVINYGMETNEMNRTEESMISRAPYSFTPSPSMNSEPKGRGIAGMVQARKKRREESLDKSIDKGGY